MAPRGVAGHHQKLLAAPAHQVVAVAEHLQQPVAHLHQHGIAGGMTMAVVDLLEQVDVDHEEDQVGIVRHRPAQPQVGFMAAQGQCHVALDVLGQEAAVAQAGQRVGQAGIGQRGGHGLKFGRAVAHQAFKHLPATLHPARAQLHHGKDRDHPEARQQHLEPPGLPPGRQHFDGNA